MRLPNVSPVQIGVGAEEPRLNARSATSRGSWGDLWHLARSRRPARESSPYRSPIPAPDIADLGACPVSRLSGAELEQMTKVSWRHTAQGLTL